MLFTGRAEGNGLALQRERCVDDQATPPISSGARQSRTKRKITLRKWELSDGNSDEAVAKIRVWVKLIRGAPFDRVILAVHRICDQRCSGVRRRTVLRENGHRVG